MKITVEIIWDKEQTNIIGYVQVDPNTLSKMYSEDGTFVWVQYSNIPSMKRILYGTQIATIFVTMNKEKLEQLIDILSLPTYFGHERIVMDYLIDYGQSKDYIVKKDKKGNVYFTKGKIKEKEFYPCVCAHTDSVFSEHKELIEQNLRKTIKFVNKKLIAYNPLTGNRTGLAGDDLAGVFICLQMMEHFDIIKAAFFVEEEYGYQGSSNCDENFFKNVGYVIQFDAPTSNWYTNTLQGLKMFSEDFDDKVKPILEKYNVDNYSEDPYTDILALKEKFDFCCANLPTGYHKWHTNEEYVDIKGVEKGINLGIEFINKLGLEKQVYIADNHYDFDDCFIEDEICENCGEELVYSLENFTFVGKCKCGFIKKEE